MLFGKLLTGLALTSMTIVPVACAPTAEPELLVVEKRTTISDHTLTCYEGVQQHWGNIGNYISGNGGKIDVNLVASITIELQAILDLLVVLVADIQAIVLTLDDIQDSVPTFVLIVNLLAQIFIIISGACTGGALGLLSTYVVQISVQINVIANILLGVINSLLGGLLTPVVDLVLGILVGLKGDLTGSISGFTSACSPY